MSIVSLLGIKVLSNPAKFTDPYEFEITFECLEQLKDDLEWKLTYVGSSRSLEHDQELDSLLVGPVPVGINKFILTADAPSPELIPANELVSVTVILLSCSYKEREFVRVGYYVNNEYDSEELRENPPAKVQVDHIVRNILAEKPRVTRFNIAWDNEDNVDDYPPVENNGLDGDDDNEEEILDDDDEIIDMGVNAKDEEEEDEEVVHEDSKAESANRQNTINDDDIPELRKRKLENGDEEDAQITKKADIKEEEEEDKTAVEEEEVDEEEEEDLDELEAEDEEELEEEDDEDEDDEEVDEEEEVEEELAEEAQNEQELQEEEEGDEEIEHTEDLDGDDNDNVETPLDSTEGNETPKISESTATTPDN